MVKRIESIDNVESMWQREFVSWPSNRNRIPNATTAMFYKNVTRAYLILGTYEPCRRREIDVRELLKNKKMMSQFLACRQFAKELGFPCGWKPDARIATSLFVYYPTPSSNSFFFSFLSSS